MSETRVCPKCGAAVTADAPRGLCPRCLLQAGLGAAESTAAYASGFVPPTPQELAPRFPQLEILELVGQGGMGAVYKARHQGLDRLVAVKILPPQIARDPAFAERFTREARSLARLNHPNIVSVYDFGQAADLYFFVMEFVDGLNLRHILVDHKLRPEEALKLVPQLCEALQYAHDEGIVHRDIKPENILLDKKGRVKIADFGLAKLLGREAGNFTLTGTNQVMGTWHYMAPEQVGKPQEVDHRADIYSLGVVFYELLTGELPLGRFEPPSHKVQVDVRLDEVVLRALESKPERRYQHASDIKTDIESIAGGPAAAARPDGPSFGQPMPAGATPMMLVVAIGLVGSALLMAGGLGALVYALINIPFGSHEFWGWMGGAFGCFFGGGGGLIGSLNSYRQMEGGGDLMMSPDWTWLDRVLVGYTVFGCVLMAVGVLTSPWLNDVSVQSLLTMGGVFTLQGLCFLGIRLLTRRSAQQAAAAKRPSRV